MAHLLTVIVVMSFLSLGFGKVEGIKIAMLHMVGKSHFMTTKVLGDELVKRGHEVTIFVPGGRNWKRDSGHLKLIGFEAGASEEEVYNLSQSFLSNDEADMFSKMRMRKRFSGLQAQLCENMAENQDVTNGIKDADLVVAELMLLCSGALAKSHGKKWIGISPQPFDSLSAYMYRIPLNPSYSPFMGTQLPVDMSFRERLGNFIMHKLFPLLFQVLTNYYLLNGFKQKVNLSGDTDVYGMMNEAQLVIGNCDYVHDYPTPLLPNTFCAGGFLVRPAKALPAEFEDIINSREGFILVCFGSIFNTFNRVEVRRMAEAFGKLKQNVIWQLQDTYNLSFSQNIHATKWVPQNDLLGHKNIKLFISHVGINSLQEAVYHGVPVLAAPRVADQWTNAAKISNRLQMGEVVTISTVTEEELYEKIQLILTTDRYTINAQRASRRIRAKNQTPMQIAGDLVEYVIDNNYDVSHLRPHGLDLPLYIHEMWDVYFFLYVLVHISILASYYILKKLFRVCVRRKEKSE